MQDGDSETIQAQLQAVQILESITDAFFALNRDWIFTYVNAQAQPLLQQSREELLGQSIWAMFPEAVGSTFYRQYQHALHDQVTVEFEEYYPPLKTWFAVRAYPSPQGLSVYFQDVSARKQAEAEAAQRSLQIENQQLWLESVLNLMPLPLMFIEPGTARIRFVNKAANRISGNQMALDVPAEAYDTAYHVTDTKGKALTNDEMPGVRVAREGKVEGAEVIWHTAAGAHALLIDGNTLPAMYGHEAVALLAFQDVTRLKQIEQELQASQRFTQHIAETIPLLIYVYDLQERRLVYTNRDIGAVLGYGPQESPSASDWIVRLLHPDDQVRLETFEKRFELLTDGERAQVDYRLRDAQGAWRWMHGRASVFTRTPDGKPQQIIATAEDITERKHAETTLLHNAAQIAVLNQRLSRAMQETHHRVKNNLQVLAALADMHVLDGEAMVPIEALRRLTSHVLALAAVHEALTEQAKRDGQAESVDAEEVFGKLAPFLQQLAQQRSFHVKSENVSLTARQATALALLLSELVTNATRYGQGRICVDFTEEANIATLIVTDEGQGFPPDFRAQDTAHAGLELILTVARWDLRGDAVFMNRAEGGAQACITFPLILP